MTTAEAQAVQTGIHDLMYEHRARWAAAVLGEGAVDLRAADDPVAALADATSAVWLDGYVPAAREALVAAERRGARVIVAVPAGSDDADDLPRALPGATVIPQAVASGSLIGSGSDARVDVHEAASPDRASWLLVCVNVDPEATDVRLDVAVSAELATRLARLEEALEALREANVRLAREKVGRYDAAAGAITGRAEREAAYLKQRFEFEQELAQRHHDWFKAAEARLEQPHHRFADRVYNALRRVPGLKRLRGS